MKIALYQPDIPQNTGTLLRFGVCMNVNIHIIEPAGFDASDRGLRRAGMDYLAQSRAFRHLSFSRFLDSLSTDERLVLLTTRSDENYTRFSYNATDVLLFGRESAGVPPHVHEAAAHRLTIPMAPGARSLNLALSVAMVTGEALRQTGNWPPSA